MTNSFWKKLGFVKTRVPISRQAFSVVTDHGNILSFQKKLILEKLIQYNKDFETGVQLYEGKVLLEHHETSAKERLSPNYIITIVFLFNRRFIFGYFWNVEGWAHKFTDNWFIVFSNGFNYGIVKFLAKNNLVNKNIQYKSYGMEKPIVKDDLTRF